MTASHQGIALNPKVIGTTVACGALALTLAGCGQPKQPEPVPEASAATQEAPAEKAPEPQEAKLAIPNCAFTDSGHDLVDVTGKSLESPITTMSDPGQSESETKLIGLAAQDRYVVLATSSEYDKEWDTAYDKKSSFSLIDGEGKTVASLDDVLSKYGTAYELNTRGGSSTLAFTNDCFILPLTVVDEQGQRHSVNVAVDRDGKELFSVGDLPACTIQSTDSDTDLRFYNGAHFIYGNKTIVDTSGKTLATVDTDGDIRLCGEGHYAGLGHKVGQIFNYDGSLALDVTTLSDDKIAYGFRAIDAVLGDNLLLLEGQEQNPHGGSSRTVKGIYNLATSSWAVEPSCGLMNARPSYNGLVYVSAKSKDVLEGTYSNADSDDDGYACLINASGDVVFDLSMSGIDKLADLTEFDAMYLSDGYWYLQGFKGNPALNEDGASGLIVYFDESGKFLGCTPTTMHPDPSYDSLNAAMSVDH